MIAALPWGSRVAALAEAYREAGLRPSKAFRAALAAARPPGVEVPDEEPRHTSELSELQTAILDALDDSSEPLTAKQIGAAIGRPGTQISDTLRRLERRGEIARAGSLRTGGRFRPEFLWERP